VKRWDRSAVNAALPAAVVALIAGIVSYSHIVSLATTSGQSYADAHLLPFAVDGLIVAGTVILLAGSLLGWLCVAPGISATLYANVMSGAGHGAVSAIVAAWPAAAFALASFTLERWLKTRGQGERTVPVFVPAVPVAPETVPEASAGEPDAYAHLNGHRELARELFTDDLFSGTAPSIRRIRDQMHVGQPRASEIQRYLKALASND
jgi:hypothetical protein